MQISHQCDRLCVKIASALFANRRVDEQMALNDKQVKQIRKPFRITENVLNVQFVYNHFFFYLLLFQISPVYATKKGMRHDLSSVVGTPA
jgi:hypothetical protein